MRLLGARRGLIRTLQGGVAGGVLLLAAGGGASRASAAPGLGSPAAQVSRGVAAAAPGHARSVESHLDDWSIALDATGAWVSHCSLPSCAVPRRVRLALPEGVRFTLPASTRLRVLQVAGEELLHCSVFVDRARAFEALVAPPPEGSPEGAGPYVVAALVSGLGPQGQPGQAIQIRPRSSGGHSVVRGSLRPGVSLCGRTALLEPELLRARPWGWVPARYQRLSRSMRRSAVSLPLEAVDVPSPSNPGLVARWSSSGSSPGHLTDSDPATAWSPVGSSGARGAFALLSAPRDLRVEAIELRLPRQAGLEPPRSLFLLLDEALYRLTPDARARGWYRASLPRPARADCVALVLGRSPAAASVGVSELRLVSALADVDSSALAQRIADDPGDAFAWAELERRGSQAYAALAAAFPQLGRHGQARASALLRGAACELRVPLLLASFAAGTELRAWEETLGRCSTSVRAALEQKIAELPKQAEVPEPLLQALAAVSEEGAAQVVALRLARQGCTLPVGARAQLRAQLLRFGATGARAVEQALPNHRDLCAQLELLRGHTGPPEQRTGEATPPASFPAASAVSRVLSSVEGFGPRYRALEVASRWAKTRPTAAEYVRSALRDPDWRLRARAVELLPDATLSAAAIAALSDPAVRVRQAAATALRARTKRRDAQQALLRRLEVDPWPRVRVAAVEALASAGGPPQEGSAAALLEALERGLRDDSWLVRRASVQAAAGLRPPALSGQLQSLLEDEDEDPAVRSAAAAALARRCELTAADTLTQLSERLRDPRADRATLELGRGALDALARLSPSDLPTRLRGLTGSRQPAVRRVAGRALARAQGLAACRR